CLQLHPFGRKTRRSALRAARDWMSTRHRQCDGSPPQLKRLHEQDRDSHRCARERGCRALERAKGSFNSYPLDCLAGPVAAIKDDAWFQETRERIIANCESLVHALSELGFEVLPSVANFAFARHRSAGAHISLPSFGSAAFWYDISRNLKSKTSYALRSERRTNAAA